MSRPIPRTATEHPFNWGPLGAEDFERLCSYLVTRLNFKRIERRQGGREQYACDIVATKNGLRWAFQCKNVSSFGPKDAALELERLKRIPKDDRPDRFVLLVTRPVTGDTRKAMKTAAPPWVESDLWDREALEAQLRRFPALVRQFFGPGMLPSRRRARASIRPRDVQAIVEGYRQELGRRHGRRHHPRIDGVATACPYWELRLKRHENAEDTFDPDRFLSVDDPALPSTGLVVIQAEPGSGKTVLLDHLAAIGADATLRVPVLVALGCVASGRAAGPDGAVAKAIRTILGRRAAGAVDRVRDDARSARGVLLLDGWDEVPPAARPIWARYIREWSRSSRVVITTRRHQDLSALDVDSSTPRFEIAGLQTETVTDAIRAEIESARHVNSARSENLNTLSKHWRRGSATLRQLTRNPHMLRLLMEYYAHGARDDAQTESALIQSAVVFACPRPRLKTCPPEELLPDGRVAFALGQWCWTTLRDSSAAHGRRELKSAELETHWRSVGLPPRHLEQCLQHLAQNTIWLQVVPASSARASHRYQFGHALFMSWFAACFLVARSQAAVESRKGSSRANLEDAAKVIDELRDFTEGREHETVDRATIGQVFRFVGALLPLPRAIRIEDILCDLLNAPSSLARKMAFQLVMGQTQSVRSDNIPGRIRKSSAELIASQIRGKPRSERVAMIREWSKEARQFDPTRDQDEAIELLRVLRGLLLTPSGDGTFGQRSTAPQRHWAERDSEVIVRSHSLVCLLRDRMFERPDSAPDELHELVEGRLEILEPMMSGPIAPGGHWVSIPTGAYAVGSQEMAAKEERGLPPQIYPVATELRVAKYPVTVDQYRQFNPDDCTDPVFDGPARAKVFLNWFDAVLFARWTARLQKNSGIDLPSEREWEVACSFRRSHDDEPVYPWSHGALRDLVPEAWRTCIEDVIRNLTPDQLKLLATEAWDNGPWFLPLDSTGREVAVELGDKYRTARSGMWDADGVAQWTADAAIGGLDTSGASDKLDEFDRSRYARGSGWGPGREELYRCAYRRAFTPSFSSFLTGCRLVWRSRPWHVQ